MFNQIVYVGPLKFEIEYTKECEQFQFPNIFEKPIGHSHTVYHVKMYQGIIKRDQADIIELDELDEVDQNDIICRYMYQYVDGTKHDYAKACLCDHDIDIMVDLRGGWVIGKSFDVWRYLFLEILLMRENAFVLHSASIIWKDQAILFSAPSGTGKSTQADLWKKHENAIGFNGDRNLLYYDQGQWFVCGFPWHGSSLDCINVQVPLRSIVIVRQAKVDQIVELSPIMKYQCIYSEVTLNRWNKEHVEKINQLIDLLIDQADLIQLNCTMEKTAVQCLKQRLESDAHAAI